MLTNLHVIEDAIQTYEQIKKDLEGALGRDASGTEALGEEVIVAVKKRITNIRDFLVPAFKKAQADVAAADAAVALASNSGKTAKKAVAAVATNAK